MFLIVGLGNVGKEFEMTRHNYGFLAVDKLIESLLNESWTHKTEGKKKYDSIVDEFVDSNGETVALAKPQTMMNLSGIAVKKLLKGYKVESANLVVIHDDLDLPTGGLKISFGASAAGHNGIKSIIEQIGTKEFIRVRLGIETGVKHAPTEEFVLQKFSKGERNMISDVIEKIPDLYKALHDDGLAKTMSLFNANKKPTA